MEQPMSSEDSELSGPDLVAGVPESDLAEGAMLAGHAEGEPVLLARQGGQVYAIGATCTHYGGPLAEGLLGDGTVHCPWHHACFDLATGRAVGAPALNPVSCWTVEQRDGRIRISGRKNAPTPPEEPAGAPQSIVIVGAGAAGNAAAEELRAQGYLGAITLIGMEDDVPYDRPNLSKDYLAGNAPEEWIPLRTPEFYAEQNITLRLGAVVERIDAAARRVVLAGGDTISYDRLLLATGAEPVRMPVPTEEGAPVFYLRSLDDCRAIIAAASEGKRAVVIGASFIGLEVAAALRMRKLAVQVVGPEAVPFEKVLGRDVGTFLRGVHEQNGVEFHLESKVDRIGRASVHLDNGADLAADMIVVGIGVRPRTALAESAGAALDKGVIVNERMKTSVPGIYAAGDIARVPNGRTGRPMRVEHWVVAERQGQAAARNMLGLASPFTDVPFFWSTHYGTTVSYTGHADRWDRAELSGSLGDGSATVGYWSDNKLLAVATLGRDQDALRAERAMAEDDEATLERLVRSR
jgi:NADPH-dependent 2,4-dienoyl-CoA reductase/sulfur reductase-like enzyme/nitrite reductase/ring-hydroxylating ferredoxin subunit